MSGKQARRPPVAPKPSFVQHDHHVASARGVSPLPSPALQGATLAFKPAHAKTPAPYPHASISAPHNPSTGALIAATAASIRKQQNGPPALESVAPQPLRGRQLTTDRLPVPVVSYTSLSPHRPEFRPHAPRSTSAVAAVAASAKTSPIRRPNLTRDPGSYLARRDLSQVRGWGMNTSSNNSALDSFQQSAAALAGAKASMVTAPVQVRTRTGERQRNDPGSFSHLTLPTAQPSSVPSPSSLGTTAAAAAATRNASNLEARRRALSISQTSSPGAPISRNLTTSPQSINGSAWPPVRLSPPRTDSESETGSPRVEQYYKPLPAPTPVRAHHAAINAQERAHAISPNSPILDVYGRMTASSMADAMVAGSIASAHVKSRARSPSPMKVPPPVPNRRSKSVGAFEGPRHLVHLAGMRSDTRTHTPQLKPLPKRPMRQTMRSFPEHDEQTGEKRGRKHWRRHPNMHHEGDRRRWRDNITDRERKRYEGVWAANRGLLLDCDPEYFDLEQRRNGTSPNDLVVNVIVRDVWDRSRLPGDVLEEIWDLVAQPDLKTLKREEFAVGMWLIDQRLKGRKLPVKVSQSVWTSVRHHVKI